MQFRIAEDKLKEHQKDCKFLKTKCICCEEALNIFDHEIHLNICNKQFIFCDKLYEKPYKEEFKELISNFDSFYQNIKKIGKHSNYYNFFIYCLV